TTVYYHHSLHDALPILEDVGLRHGGKERKRRPLPVTGSCSAACAMGRCACVVAVDSQHVAKWDGHQQLRGGPPRRRPAIIDSLRSEEHTSELQSPCNLV